MKLYYVPQTRSNRPRWLLEELGVPYEMVRLDPRKGDTQAPEYLKVHPLGKVPALEHEGVSIFESAAIVAWLADRFIEKGFAPAPTAPERGQYFQWLFFGMATLEPPLADFAWHTRLLPEDKRVPAVAERARAALPQLFSVLEEALAGRSFLMGEQITAADVVVGSNVMWASAMGLLHTHANLSAYARRLHDRPACKRARAD
jgi:glutathione S-transferase